MSDTITITPEHTYKVGLTSDITVQVGLPSIGHGVAGARGDKGYSVYELAVQNGYTGTVKDFTEKYIRGTIVSAETDSSGNMTMTDINGNKITTTLHPLADAVAASESAETSAAEALASQKAAKTSETAAAASAATAKEQAALVDGQNLVHIEEEETITGAKTFNSLTVTGSTSVPTPNTDNSSNAIATTAFVQARVAALVNGAPSTLDTLNEIAAALGNDSNLASNLTKSIGEKVAKAGGTITGPILYDKTPSDSTELVNKAYVDSHTATAVSNAHHYIKRSTAYSVGDVLESPSLPPGCVIVVTTAGTTGASEPDWSNIKTQMGGG